MITRFFRPLGLVAVFLTVSCAPAGPKAPPSEAETALPVTVTLASSPVPEVATPVPTAVVQAVATSRGPNLEATDPSTVSLASGQLQLVEFFRFT